MSQKMRSHSRGVPEISPRLLALFALYVDRYLKRHFHAVRISKQSARLEVSRPDPVVVYLNHPSWWDPLVVFLLGRRLFGERSIYGPIDAAALDRYRFLGRLGLFGVEQGTIRGARRFVEVSEAIVSTPATSLWITAQGHFADPRVRPLDLAPGLAHLVRRMERGSIVPLALEYPFWNERFPEALAHIGEPLDVADLHDRTTDRIRVRLIERLEETMAALDRQSVRREESDFVCLLGGGAGVGGIYDAWRRVRARLAGQDFDVSHTAMMRRRRDVPENPAAESAVLDGTLARRSAPR